MILENILNTTILGLLFGTLGTTIGGIIGVNFKKNSSRFLSFIMQFAAGLMLAIVCFELIPEALDLSNIFLVFCGFLVGVGVMILSDNIVKKIYSKNNKIKNNSLLKVGIIVGIGLAIHNFPEGLAIGSGFEASVKLGYAIAFAILLHDIPEG